MNGIEQLRPYCTDNIILYCGVQARHWNTESERYVIGHLYQSDSDAKFYKGNMKCMMVRMASFILFTTPMHA